MVVGHPSYPDASKVERSGRGKVPVEMRLRVHVDGREPYEVAYRSRVPGEKCPVSGQTLPVSVDADDPQAVRVDWDAAPTLAEQAQVDRKSVV